MSDQAATVRLVGDLVFLGSPTLGPRMGMRKGTSALAHYERGCELEARDPDGAMAAYRRMIAEATRDQPQVHAAVEG